jgi:alpha-tubulin suppressor-like RCC1 family protein
VSKAVKAVLAVVLAAGLIVLVAKRRDSDEFGVGPARPAGKVTPQLALAMDRALLLAPDGSLWIWGGAQLGPASVMPNQTITPTPVRVGADSDWVRVTAGFYQNLAIKQDGSLWGWGWNHAGILSNTLTNYIPAPRRIGTDDDWTEVSTGASHVMGLRKDGSLWTWGQNRYGQVGDGGVTTNCWQPFRVTARPRWKAIAASAFASYAIAHDGTLWGWGYLHQPISGRLNASAPTMLNIGSNWVAISATDYLFTAVREDGTLWAGGANVPAWLPLCAGGGTNSLAQIGSETNWVEAWAGARGIVARRKDGSWWASSTTPGVRFLQAGGESKETPGLWRVADELDAWAVGLGSEKAVILLRDGTLWTAGERLGVPGKVRLLDRLDAWSSPLFGPRRMAQPTPPVDRQLRRLWQLPQTSTNSVPEHDSVR